MNDKTQDLDSIASLASWVSNAAGDAKMVRHDYLVQKAPGGDWDVLRRGVRLASLPSKEEAMRHAEDHQEKAEARKVSKYTTQTRNVHARVCHETYAKLEETGGPIGGVAGKIIEAWAAGGQAKVSDVYDNAVDRLNAVRLLQRDTELATMVGRAMGGRLPWAELERSLRRDLVALMAAELGSQG